MTYDYLPVDYLIDWYKTEKLFFISYKQINITDMNTYNKLLLDEAQAMISLLNKYLNHYIQLSYIPFVIDLILNVYALKID